MDAAALPVARSRRVPRGLLRAASDERLVARLRAGDDAAFEVIYDRHHRDLLAFCRHMLGSREEAEDALQLVFLSMHRHLRTDDRPVRVKPWLYAVARNRCLSVLRARREAVALDDVREPSTDGLLVAAEVERRQDLKDMLADLRHLPDEQRAALLLCELGGLSHDDVAEVLEVRRAKVKALVFQAREALMTARSAREADCHEIREQLATLRGAALRRSTLRRHVATCPGCAAFKAEVKRQRSALALLLPVVPGTVAATASGGGVVAGSLATKALLTVAITGAAAGGGAVAVHELERPHQPPKAAATPQRDPVQPAARATTPPPPRGTVVRARANGRPEEAGPAPAPVRAPGARSSARVRALGHGRSAGASRASAASGHGRASAPGQLAKDTATGGGAKAPGTTQANPTPTTPRRATAPGRTRSASAPGQAKRATSAPAAARKAPAQPSKAVSLPAPVKPAKPARTPAVVAAVPGAAKGKPAGDGD
jgi:RNA polymerase sigma factor (sigma-70 family)